MDASERDSGKWTDKCCLVLTFPELFRLGCLIISIFLTRISCHKTTLADGYYGAWPGWVVSISVLPLTESWMSLCFFLSSVVERHFNLSATLPVGGGLLVPYSLSGSPVLKQPVQMVTMVPGQGGRFQSVCFP